MILVLALLLSWPGVAKDKTPCRIALEIKGAKAGGLGAFYRIGICEKKKKSVLTEVSLQSHPMRNVSISQIRFDQITNGVKSTLVDVKDMQSPVSPCRHMVQVRIDWEGAKEKFTSCDQDKLSLLVLKLSQLTEDLYLEK